MDVREWHFLPASCQAEEQIAVEVVAEEIVVPTTNLNLEKGDASLSLSHVLSFGCAPHGHHQRCSHMEGAPFHHTSLGKNSGVSDESDRCCWWCGNDCGGNNWLLCNKISA